MTGLVPVIHVGVAPEGLGWAGNWKRVDGRDKPRDKPGHDGERRPRSVFRCGSGLNSNVDNSITREL